MASTIHLQPCWQCRMPAMLGNRACRSNWFRRTSSSRNLVLCSIPWRSARKFACVAVPISKGVEFSSSQTPGLVSTLGTAQTPPSSVRNWSFSDRHLLMLNVIACVAAVSASCLFFAAIPTLMAFKRAAESLEKLLDVTREELPGTMTAVRLSGMEISDLTMELSDLGQQISEGVRSSTRAVQVAEDGLRRMTNIASLSCRTNHQYKPKR